MRTSLFAAPGLSIAQQRTEIIEKAKSDLVGIREKLSRKMTQQYQAGNKDGARTTQLRLQAANNLVNMLDAPSQAGGDIFKVELIKNYAPILNTQNFGGMSVREVMNYRANYQEVYDGQYLTDMRVKTNSPNKDAQVLNAMEGRALYYASHETYVIMHEGFTRGMANVSLALNDTFADLNPATPILEAGLGVKVSGEEIGKELSAGERVQAAGQALVETVVDYKVDQLAKDAVKGISTQVGPGRTAATGAGRPANQGRVIGQADLDDVNNLDDIMPFTGLDNFNVDLRTGQITTSSRPGGRISPDGQAAIEQGLKTKGPLGGDQKIDLQGKGTAATAALPAPGAPAGGREKVIGRVDLENVNDVMDMAGLTGLENFNIDLRTGRVTASDTPGGRISPEGQAAIEEGLKPKGPLGGDKKIDVNGIQNQTTQIDAQGQTTVMNGQVWGDVNPDFKMQKPDKPGRKPKEGLKPFWDVFDLKPEKGKQVPSGSVSLNIVIFIPDGNAAPLDLFLFPLSGEPPPPEPASDPFGDCLGPGCPPAFGGASAPIGADLVSGGGPASPFGAEDPFLHDHPSDH